MGSHMWRENLDLLTPPDETFPARQEPAEAIRQLTFKARIHIRNCAMFIAKRSRTGFWTNPDIAHLNLLKRFVDRTYEDLPNGGMKAPYEAVDAYFRKAYRDVEEWYARKRARRHEGKHDIPTPENQSTQENGGDPGEETA